MRPVFQRRCTGSSERMKTVMDRDGLVHLVGFVCGSTRPRATRIWHGIRLRRRPPVSRTVSVRIFSTEGVARQRCLSDALEDARLDWWQALEKPNGDRNHDLRHSETGHRPEAAARPLRPMRHRVHRCSRFRRGGDWLEAHERRPFCGKWQWGRDGMETRVFDSQCVSMFGVAQIQLGLA